MKLLLLDRPKERDLIRQRDVEFFGPWAQPITSPEELSKPAFEPYPSPESVHRASQNAMEKAEELLSILYEIMPEITEVEKSPRFWRLLFAHYIITLTSIVEDIYQRQKALPDNEYILGIPQGINLDKWPCATLEENPFFIQVDDEFRLFAASFCLQDHYDKTELVKYQRIETTDLQPKQRHLYFKKYAGRMIGRMNAIFGSKNMFDRNDPVSMIFEAGQDGELDYGRGNALIFDSKLLGGRINANIKMDIYKREQIKKLLPHPYDELIRLSMPLLLLEGLNKFMQCADGAKLRKYERIKKVYTHGQGYAGSDNQRLYLALLADQNKNIVSIQHGGSNYLAHSGMYLDRVIVDEYISWGRGALAAQNNEKYNQARPLPSLYLTKIRSRRKKTIKWDLLFVVLEENRFVKWLYSPLFPDLARDYFAREKVMFSHLCASRKTAIKVYPRNFGWGQAQWIKREYPQADLLTWGYFVDYSLSAELVIVDYNSTAFLEMLALNHPFLATWDRRWFRGNQVFEECLDSLRSVGVFHEDPASLIREYKSITDQGVGNWWQNRERQKAIIEMAKEFALTADDARELWQKELTN